MSVVDLKARLADIPGIDGLTMQLLAGRQVFGWNGLIAAVDPMATDDEIESAIRMAARLPANRMTDERPKDQRMSVTGAAYAGGSLKAQLQAIKDKLAQGQSKMASAMEKMNQAAEAHNQLADTVAGEAESLMADIGQFTNNPPV